MQAGWIVAGFAFLIGAVCLLDLLATPFQRVSRARVEKFARRQTLTVTVENGPLVIRYLATTRRWRGGGLLVSAAATVGVPLVVEALWPQRAPSHVGVSALAMFVGWFVGAVVAEWRVSAAAAGPRRAAVLEPRRLADYVPQPSRALPMIAWTFLGAYELVAVAYVAARHPGGLASVLWWLALSVLAAAALVTVGRRVLLRPQRHTEPGLRAADDAIRSRSLHVLAACALAIAGYLLSGITIALSRYASPMTDGLAAPIEVGSTLLAPLLGLIIATSTAPPVVRRRAAPALDGA